MRTFVALAAVTFLLAGCADSVPNSGLDLRATAQSQAESLDGTAVMLAMFAPEWASETFGDKFEQESPEAAAINQGADPNVGDGRANAWGFLFETSDAPILVILDGNGNVLHADFIPEESNTADSYGNYAPLGRVNVDSIEAAQTIRDNNEDYTTIVKADDAIVVMALGRDADQNIPFWVFTAFQEDGDDFVFAMVNADDGSYVPIPFFN